MSPDSSNTTAAPKRDPWLIIWLLVCVVTLLAEVPRWLNPALRQEILAGWLSGRSPDWLPFLPWLLLAPVISMLPQLIRQRRHWSAAHEWLSRSASNREVDGPTLVLSLLLAALAWWGTVRVGDEFSGLPPAYHDEYSYVIQAQTLRAGRTSYPVSPRQPQLFDQIHVLNEPDIAPPTGVFASRYFPGTGLWMLPFIRSATPAAGHQLAQVLLVVGVFWIGRELTSNAVGLLAAVLTAVSPGLLLFSNLLLAHHPTLVGLTLFIWMLLRARRTGNLWSYGMAGASLGFATLCRPMTAAGCSLPVGLVFACWWLTGHQRFGIWTGWQHQSSAATAAPNFVSRSTYALALGAPLVIAFLGMLWYQHSITGSPFVSPYQLYTDRYTPRHVYGFNNVTRGEQHLGPKVLDNYDRWAENLTPTLAIKNVWARLLNSWRWTLGIVPCLATALTWLLIRRTPAEQGHGWWIVVSAIVSLHLVHVPYWFSGIMGWHYVFESAPLWLLLVAQASVLAIGKSGQRLWIGGLLCLSVAVNLWTFAPVWPARLDVGIAELQYPRERYARFRETVEQARRGQSVLVLVKADPADRSMDYVTNSAERQGPVLVGRWRDENLDRIRQDFPDRQLLIFDAASNEWSQAEPRTGRPSSSKLPSN